MKTLILILLPFISFAQTEMKFNELPEPIRSKTDSTHFISAYMREDSIYEVELGIKKKRERTIISYTKYGEKVCVYHYKDGMSPVGCAVFLGIMFYMGGLMGFYRNIFIISLFLFSCHEEKMVLRKWDTYKIKEGNHSSGTHIIPFTGNTLEFDAVFDQSAIYKIEPSNQTDINKLLGFSDCNSRHHENSARFGWNWTDSLNIYAYCYSGGKVNHKYITSINLDKVYRYRIYKDKYRYIFYLAGKHIEMERNPNEGSGYLLFPYFGGQSVPDHDITIKLKYI